MQKNHKPSLPGLPTLLFKLTTGGILILSLLTYFFFSHWLLELFANFQAQYCLAFFLFTLIWLIKKQPFWIIVSTFGFISSFYNLIPLYFQPTAQAQPQTTNSELTLLHSNINYHTTNFFPLVKIIDEKKPDIITVVELPSENFTQLAELIPQYSTQYHLPGKGSLGVAVFINKKFRAVFEKIVFNQEQYPSIKLKLLDNNQQEINLLLIHPPPPITKKTQAIRTEIIKAVANWAITQTTPTIVVGDFNATSWSKAFQDLLANGQLTDSRMGTGLQPSWPTFLPKLFRIPIDHILVKDLTVYDRQVLSDVGSDHLPVWIQLSY